MKKVIFLLIILFLEGNYIKADEPWEPPVGIPVPSFGINETYRMYDSEANRNPELTYYQSSSGGYYTHFINPDNPDATDSGNIYGTEEKPRKTLPITIPAGSIVEVHGNYTIGGEPYSDYRFWIAAWGTEQYPVFVRGVGTPVFTGMEIRLVGSYVIIEDFELNDSLFSYNQGYTPNTHDHIVLRGHEIHHSDAGGGSMIGINGATDCVVYDNYIHHNGLVPYGAGSDVHGVSVSGVNSQRIWILDNNICFNDGDSIQINGTYADETRPNYIYIGANQLYSDRENAIDIKDSNNVIISQNEIYGYNAKDRVFGCDPNPRQVHGSDGTAVLPSNEGGVLTWVMFNDIHDSVVAIRIDNSVIEVDATVYMVGNLIHNITRDGVVQWDNETSNSTIGLMSNIIYNTGAAFRTGSAIGDEGTIFYICNNIISKTVGWSSGDYWIGIGRDSSADNALIENNVFYNGGGFRWGIMVYYDTLNELVIRESGKGQGCIETNPMFIDPENGNFNLQSDSPIHDLETSDKVKEITNLFFMLYGINLADDIDGVPRVSQLMDLSDAGEADSNSTDSSNTDSSSTDSEDLSTEDNNAGSSEDNSNSENSVDDTDSSEPEVPISNISIQPLPMTSSSEVTGSNNNEQPDFATIDTLYGTSSRLHVKDSKTVQVRSIKVRRIFERFNALYCPTNRNKNSFSDLE